jgi:antitoxin (DNA-binding transcriptional repressor) of toxin-antitoxin stability system
MALRDVKNRLSEVADQVKREHDRLVITRHGKPAAAIEHGGTPIDDDSRPPSRGVPRKPAEPVRRATHRGTGGCGGEVLSASIWRARGTPSGRVRPPRGSRAPAGRRECRRSRGGLW